MPAELGAIVIIMPLDGGLLDGSIHPFDLSVGPGMIDLGAAVLDAAFTATHVEYMGDESCRRPVGITRREAELDTVVSQHGVDAVRNSCDQRF